MVWAGIETRRRRAFTKFKSAMEAYTEEHGSALVPTSYVDDDGYPLGAKLHDFRYGGMRKGMSDQTHIEAWAEALPKWAWNAQKTDEYREKKARHSKSTWKNATEEKRAKWCKSIKDASNRSEMRAKRSQRQKDWWTNRTVEQKADRIAKYKTTMSTDASKAKRSKITKDRHATARRAELERARLIAIPFVKSQKRRKEMRAASTNFSGRVGNAVLYMISKDGLTICRIDNRGAMHTVGPVVDPAPPDAFDSD